MLKTRIAGPGMEEGEGRNVEKIYQDKNTIVEITVHTKPKRVSILPQIWSRSDRFHLAGSGFKTSLLEIIWIPSVNVP
jgi:hypothetical protein